MEKPYICSSDGLEILGNCLGPSPGGRCPRVDAGDVVPCAGRSLLATDPDGRRTLLLSVEPDIETCPLATASWAGHARAIWPSRTSS
jgi:hypothetical protein